MRSLLLMHSLPINAIEMKELGENLCDTFRVFARSSTQHNICNLTVPLNYLTLTYHGYSANIEIETTIFVGMFDLKCVESPLNVTRCRLKISP